MHKFDFRLKTVLHVRAMDCDLAKQLLMAKRYEINSMEESIQTIKLKIMDLFNFPAKSINDFQQIEVKRQFLEAEITSIHVALSVLRNEEETLKFSYIEAKRNHESVLQLEQSAKAEYRKARNLFEQKQLDEWTTLRYATKKS